MVIIVGNEFNLITDCLSGELIWCPDAQIKLSCHQSIKFSPFTFSYSYTTFVQWLGCILLYSDSHFNQQNIFCFNFQYNLYSLKHIFPIKNLAFVSFQHRNLWSKFLNTCLCCFSLHHENFIQCRNSLRRPNLWKSEGPDLDCKENVTAFPNQIDWWFQLILFLYETLHFPGKTPWELRLNKAWSTSGF